LGSIILPNNNEFQIFICWQSLFVVSCQKKSMAVLIIYSTKHGTTEKIANIIRHSSKYEVVLNNLKQKPKPDLSGYDKIILGGSIHMGKISGRLKKFMLANKAELLQKPLGIYICCMFEEQSEAQVEKNFPIDLREHSIASICVGGEFLFEKMNQLERTIVKRVVNINESVSKLKDDELQAFIHLMEQD
jgi:menaquinone-dependent protoporphyrinogen oxidase